MASPLFAHRLAQQLGKSIRELEGGPPGMSAHEYVVEWPLFFQTEARLAERKRKKQ